MTTSFNYFISDSEKSYIGHHFGMADGSKYYNGGYALDVTVCESHHGQTEWVAERLLSGSANVQLECRENTKDTSKMGKSCCTDRFNKKSKLSFYRPPKAVCFTPGFAVCPANGSHLAGCFATQSSWACPGGVAMEKKPVRDANWNDSKFKTVFCHCSCVTKHDVKLKINWFKLQVVKSVF